MGWRDVRGAVIDVFCAGGFTYHGEFAIRKNPQVIARRQKLHSLLFITARRNARQLAPAVNDYVLIFQKPGQAVPVPALPSDDNPGGWLSTEEWIRDAGGVWTDIRETDVLEGWRGARAEGDEKHVCPLQLTPIRRLIRLYSNPGEPVLDPFMGIGSTACVALQEGRRAVGFELKESYYRVAVRNLQLGLAQQSDGLPLFGEPESSEPDRDAGRSPRWGVGEMAEVTCRNCDQEAIGLLNGTPLCSRHLREVQEELNRQQDAWHDREAERLGIRISPEVLRDREFGPCAVKKLGGGPGATRGSARNSSPGHPQR